MKKSPQKPPKASLITVNAFAENLGYDPRKIRRRIIANNVQPKGKNKGGFPLYDQAELAGLLDDEDKPGKKHGLRLVGNNLLRVLAETASRFSMEHAATVLPDVIGEFFEGNLSKSEASRLAANVWVALACRLTGLLTDDAFDKALRADNQGVGMDQMWRSLGFADKSTPPISVPLRTPGNVLTGAMQAGMELPEIIDIASDTSEGEPDGDGAQQLVATEGVQQ